VKNNRLFVVDNNKDFRSDDHYVSQGYLKRWESSHKKVYVYRTLVSHQSVKKWKEQSIKGIAYHKHLYTQLLSGIQSDEIERWFNQWYETPAENSILKAISDQRLTNTDWQLLVNFLAAHDVRTPLRLIEHLRRAEKQLPVIMNDILTSLEEKLRRKDNATSENSTSNNKIEGLFPLAVSIDKNKDKDYARIKVETTPGRSTWIFSIKHLLQNTARILHKNKWTIMKPAKGMHWPTSDNPVVKLNYYSPGNYDFRGGWYNPGSELLFPLGPNHIMYAQVGKRPPLRGTRFSESQTELIRRLITENAHRYIFSNYVDQRLEIYRPRIVSRDQYNSEIAQWKKWHEVQSKIESKYFGDWNVN
jgi:hypothetical protein